MHIRHRDIGLRADALIDDVTVFAEKVFTPALNLDGGFSLLLQVLHDLRYFQRQRIAMGEDQIIAHPVGRIVRFIEQGKYGLVLSNAVEDLLGVADLILKRIFHFGILRGDHAAELVEDRQLAGPHGLQCVGVRQRPHLVGQEHTGKLTVQAAGRVIQRNIFVLLHVADDGIP